VPQRLIPVDCHSLIPALLHLGLGVLSRAGHLLLHLG
jgi:hypothetical protein